MKGDAYKNGLMVPQDIVAAGQDPATGWVSLTLGKAGEWGQPDQPPQQFLLEPETAARLAVTILGLAKPEFVLQAPQFHTGGRVSDDAKFGLARVRELELECTLLAKSLAAMTERVRELAASPAQRVRDAIEAARSAGAEVQVEAMHPAPGSTGVDGSVCVVKVAGELCATLPILVWEQIPLKLDDAKPWIQAAATAAEHRGDVDIADEATG